MSQECLRCAVGEDEAYLVKCPVCHKMVCEECRFLKSGQVFCSRGCGEMFFHQDEDEIDEKDS